jgi:hypothetical protein
MYSLNWTDPTLKASFTLPDSVIDTTSTSLELTGKSSVNWGQPEIENFLQLLENFASNGAAPLHPTIGQSWYNNTTGRMNIYIGSADTYHSNVFWRELANRRIDFPNTGAITGPTYPGDLWFQTQPTPVLAGSFVVGNTYVIASVGTTDFTTIGASANTVGITFIATGAGTGTGTATAQYFLNITTDGINWSGVAPIVSPNFTGIPAAPTAAQGTNTKQLATTAFVTSSPKFTGIPIAPTAVLNTNTTQLATTAFVVTQISGTSAASFSAGTRIAFNMTTPPTGWTKDTSVSNDAVMRLVTGTVGSGGSNAFSTWNGYSSTGGHTLVTSEMPSHAHSITDPHHYHILVDNGHAHPLPNVFYGSAPWGGAGTGSLGGTISTTETAPTGITMNTASTGITGTNSAGSDGSHNHPLTNNVLYYDFIIAHN